MLSYHALRTAIAHPLLAAMHLHGTIRHTLFDGPDGIPVVEKDWDNLIILDACRYDLFQEVSDLDGDLSATTSLGSSTGEFMEKNFSNGKFPEIVYVSANPNPTEVDAKFHDVVSLYETEWDDELHTVRPGPVVDAAIRAQEEYPNKRLIVHFLQPHYPWIGPDGKKFHEEYGYGGLTENNIWVRLRNGKIPAECIWNVYRENLEITLEHVQELLDNLMGKTVITSDHGNGFGERGVYGHPDRVYTKPLINVPWLEIEGGPRKQIVAGEGSSAFTVEDEDKLQDQLRDLGYVGD